MKSAICRDPANALLPWLVNGTLDAADEARVADHVGHCAVCSYELDALAEVARGLVEYGGAVAATPRRPVVPWVVAASLLVPALLGIYWGILGFPGRRPAVGSVVARNDQLDPTVILDLGDGPTRGASTHPVLVLTPGARRVVSKFRLPVVPDTELALELQDAAGRVLARENHVRGWDNQMLCTYSFPASALTRAGEHALVLTEVVSRRSYFFPFVVDRRED